MSSPRERHGFHISLDDHPLPGPFSFPWTYHLSGPSVNDGQPRCSGAFPPGPPDIYLETPVVSLLSRSHLWAGAFKSYILISVLLLFWLGGPFFLFPFLLIARWHFCFFFFFKNLQEMQVWRSVYGTLRIPRCAKFPIPRGMRTSVAAFGNGVLVVGEGKMMYDLSSLRSFSSYIPTILKNIFLCDNSHHSFFSYFSFLSRSCTTRAYCRSCWTACYRGLWPAHVHHLGSQEGPSTDAGHARPEKSHSKFKYPDRIAACVSSQTTGDNPRVHNDIQIPCVADDKPSSPGGNNESLAWPIPS